jgi:hypothetical protein
MADPSTLREALLADALGEAAELMRRMEQVAPRVEDAVEALALADSGLRDSLAAFEGQMAAITENAKTRTLQHLAARTDEATRRTIEQQTRAMADAARLAFGTELGGGIQRLQTVLKPLVEQAGRGWERWLTYVVVAVASSAVTWVVTVSVLGR